jgi:hypothetical protein
MSCPLKYPILKKSRRCCEPISPCYLDNDCDSDKDNDVYNDDDVYNMASKLVRSYYKKYSLDKNYIKPNKFEELINGYTELHREYSHLKSNNEKLMRQIEDSKLQLNLALKVIEQHTNSSSVPTKNELKNKLITEQGVQIGIKRIATQHEEQKIFNVSVIPLDNNQILFMKKINTDDKIIWNIKEKKWISFEESNSNFIYNYIFDYNTDSYILNQYLEPEHKIKMPEPQIKDSIILPSAGTNSIIKDNIQIPSIGITNPVIKSIFEQPPIFKSEYKNEISEIESQMRPIGYQVHSSVGPTYIPCISRAFKMLGHEIIGDFKPKILDNKIINQFSSRFGFGINDAIIYLKKYSHIPTQRNLQLFHSICTLLCDTFNIEIELYNDVGSMITLGSSKKNYYMYVTRTGICFPLEKTKVTVEDVTKEEINNNKDKVKLPDGVFMEEVNTQDDQDVSTIGNTWMNKEEQVTKNSDDSDSEYVDVNSIITDENSTKILEENFIDSKNMKSDEA